MEILPDIMTEAGLRDVVKEQGSQFGIQEQQHGGTERFAADMHHIPVNLPQSSASIKPRGLANATISGMTPATWINHSLANGPTLTRPSVIATTLPRGRGRGRGRGRVRALEGDRMVPIAPKVEGSQPGFVTPTRPRARGRGSGRGRGRGRGKRKRGFDSDGEPIPDNDDDGSEEDSPNALPTVTKSGRSVQKPSAFKILEEMSSSGKKRKRMRRRDPDQILCHKCSRGHSPLTNMIVLCDGCNAGWHQWCHDPMIGRDVVEDSEQPWFCGSCLHAREIAVLPVDERVSGELLSFEQKLAHLSSLSSQTLISLLVRATSLHPDLPIFPPKPGTKDHPNPAQTASTSTLSPVPSSFSASPPPFLDKPKPASSLTGSVTKLDTPDLSHSGSTPSSLSFQTPGASYKQSLPADAKAEDPYPDHSNPFNDPPSTYPYPGRGPHKPHSTINANDLPWLLDDDTAVFSHLVADGKGGLVPLDRTGDWVGKGKLVGHI